jgi:hypothetical protein
MVVRKLKLSGRWRASRRRLRAPGVGTFLGERRRSVVVVVVGRIEVA